MNECWQCNTDRESGIGEKEKASETMCWQMENNLPISERLSACDVTASLSFSVSFSSARLGSHVRLLQEHRSWFFASSGRQGCSELHSQKTQGDASRHLCDICLSTLPAFSTSVVSTVGQQHQQQRQQRTCIDLIYLSLSTAFHYTEYTHSVCQCASVQCTGKK